MNSVKISGFSISSYIKLIGFTLAEVLITLTILGVVAAITIPVVTKKINNAQKVVQLKKAYNTLSAAFDSLAMDVGGDITANYNINSSTNDAAADAKTMYEFANKLNVIKNCGSASGCLYTSPLKYLGGNNAFDSLDSSWNNQYGKMILADGTVVVFDNYGGSCSNNAGTALAGSSIYQSVCAEIEVDINGASGPNQMGRDYFTFWLTKNGIYPMGIFNDGKTCELNSSTYGTSAGCTGKILSEGAMNY